MINKNNGHLIISSTTALKPFDKFDNVSDLNLGKEQEFTDMKNGCCWLTLRNVKVDNQYFIFSICFKDKLLKFISFVVNKDKFVPNKGWESWTEQKEKTKLSDFKKWIINELGREGKFSWGQIEADFDLKGGFSSVTIKYNQLLPTNAVDNGG